MNSETRKDREHQCHLSRKCGRRVDRTIEKATVLTQKDSLERTDGFIRKELLVTNAEEHSCLRREKPAWSVAAAPQHFEPLKHGLKAQCPRGHELELLGKAETDGWRCNGINDCGTCKSGITGDNGPIGMIKYGCKKCKYDLCKKCYDSYAQPADPYGLAEYIIQPERAMRFKKNVLASAANSLAKSFWRPPKKGLTGTNQRYVQAQELLHRNTRGCLGMKPTAPQTKRPVLFKGRGSGCFTCFKEALQEPTFARVSPADRSGPP